VSGPPVILGAGPAGVGAAAMLAKSGKGAPVVIERGEAVGGNSGSFVLEGVHCDYGSHRLHPASEPHILQMIKDALGPDLLWRPRHGRILLGGSFIHFPLKPADLALKLPKPFAAALLYDMATKKLRPDPQPQTFASVLHKGLGPAMCEAFYYPYMTKLWALPPEQLAVTLAHKRVSGNSISKIIGKVLGSLPGLRKPTTGGFYYPRGGFGRISEALRDEAQGHGAQFRLSSTVTAVEVAGGRVAAVRCHEADGEQRIETGTVLSTLPITMLARALEPAAPSHVLEACDAIRYRGMILIYLVLETDQFTEYDAHYFPELSMPISRLSEPKNYSAASEPRGTTVLCGELPCDPHESLWQLDDDALGAELVRWLGGAGLPVRARVKRTVTRRLSHAYPVYDRQFERHFATIDEHLARIEGLLTFGRQGLFAHDNTHHALAMAHAAIACLGPDGTFDMARWEEHRREFESHVVED
jgi:protoporphyrinogen oxidase